MEISNSQREKLIILNKNIDFGYKYIFLVEFAKSVDFRYSISGDDFYIMTYHEFLWKCLNHICAETIESPIKTVDLITELGMICFNNSELIHPIDWVYDLYLKYYKLPLDMN